MLEKHACSCRSDAQIEKLGVHHQHDVHNKCTLRRGLLSHMPQRPRHYAQHLLVSTNTHSEPCQFQPSKLLIRSLDSLAPLLPTCRVLQPCPACAGRCRKLLQVTAPLRLLTQAEVCQFQLCVCCLAGQQEVLWLQVPVADTATQTQKKPHTTASELQAHNDLTAASVVLEKVTHAS